MASPTTWRGLALSVFLFFFFARNPNPNPLVRVLPPQVPGGQERQGDGCVQHGVQRRRRRHHRQSLHAGAFALAAEITSALAASR